MRSGSGFGCAHRCRRRRVRRGHIAARCLDRQPRGSRPGPTTGAIGPPAVDRAADGHRRDRVDDLTIDQRRQQRATSEGERAAQRRCSAGDAFHRLQGERDRRGGNERAGCRCDGDEHHPHDEGWYAIARERSDEHHREAAGVGAIGEQRGRAAPMRWTWRLACQTQKPLTAEVQAKVAANQPGLP